MPTSTSDRVDLGINRGVAGAFGAVYLVVGVVGFFVTGFSRFADSTNGQSLAGFAVNPLHNAVHVLVGLALLAASARLGAARAVNGLVGAVYLVLGLVGLPFARPDVSWNVLAVNGFDNVLHLGTAFLLLTVAAATDGRPRSAPRL